MIKFTINDNNIKLSKAVKNYYSEITYSRFVSLLKNKDIKVNGVRIKEDVVLKACDLVELYYELKEKSVDVVFEDDNILVAYKEANIEVEGVGDTLLNRFRLINKILYPVHRIDRNTLGLVVFAKTKIAEAEMLNVFKQRQVEKFYACVVVGSFKRSNAILEHYLFKNQKKSLVKIYNNCVPSSVKIITQYETVEKMADLSVLKVMLHTGKTHQIRAHLAFVGHPILGDGKYGNGEINRKYGVCDQALIAYEVAFNTSGYFSYLNKEKIMIKDHLNILKKCIKI